jgi:hypothetical protein
MQEKIKASFGQSQILCLLAGAIIFFGGYAVGYVFTGWDKVPEQFPVVHAMTSQANDSFAACTVPLSVGSEGFFILDFLTGDLSGGIINPVTSAFGASFRHNVLNDLGFQPGQVKNPTFLLVAGQVEMRRSRTPMAPAVLYVTDCASGATAAYGIPFSNQRGAVGGVASPLILLDVAQPRGGEN